MSHFISTKKAKAFHIGELCVVSGLNEKQIEFLNNQTEFLIIEEDYEAEEAREEVWERWGSSLELVKIGEAA